MFPASSNGTAAEKEKRQGRRRGAQGEAPRGRAEGAGAAAARDADDRAAGARLSTARGS